LKFNQSEERKPISCLVNFVLIKIQSNLNFKNAIGKYKFPDFFGCVSIFTVSTENLQCTYTIDF